MAKFLLSESTLRDFHCISCSTIKPSLVTKLWSKYWKCYSNIIFTKWTSLFPKVVWCHYLRCGCEIDQYISTFSIRVLPTNTFLHLLFHNLLFYDEGTQLNMFYVFPWRKSQVLDTSCIYLVACLIMKTLPSESVVN